MDEVRIMILVMFFGTIVVAQLACSIHGRIKRRRERLSIAESDSDRYEHPHVIYLRPNNSYSTLGPGTEWTFGIPTGGRFQVRQVGPEIKLPMRTDTEKWVKILVEVVPDFICTECGGKMNDYQTHADGCIILKRINEGLA